MGNQAQRSCALFLAIPNQQDLEKWAEPFVDKTLDFTEIIESLRGTNPPGDVSSAPRAFRRLSSIPRGDKAPLSVELEFLKIPSLQRPEASFVGCAYASKTQNIDAPGYTSLGSFTAGHAISLAAGKAGAKKVHAKPPLYRLEPMDLNGVKALWMMELVQELSQTHLVQAYAALKLAAKEITSGLSNGELLVPLIGCNTDTESTLPVRDCMQEAMSLAMHLAVSLDPSVIKSVVFYTPSKPAFLAFEAAAKFDKGALQILDQMVPGTVPSLNIDTLMDRIQDWYVKFGQASRGSIAEHVGVLIQIHSGKAGAETSLQQRVWATCDCGKQVAKEYLSQWKTVPGFSALATAGDQVRFLRYNTLSSLKTGLPPSMKPKPDGSPQSGLIASNQFSTLEVLRRNGDKVSNPDLSPTLNAFDMTCSMVAIIQLLGTVAIPVRNSSVSTSSRLRQA